jgi:hypothetical protein
MALFDKGTKILATDWGNGVIQILDLDLNYIKSVIPKSCLRKPSGICVQVKENGDEFIFVSDDNGRKVIMFDSSFQLIKTIGNNLNSIHYISVDSNNLYVSHAMDNNVSVFSLNNDQSITKINIERPFHSTSDVSFIYIVSNVDGECDYKIRKISKIKKGNYINVISKTFFIIIKKIKFDDWLFPHSIYLSNDQNIYTLAFELDNYNYWSKNKYLFQINKENNQITNKIQLSISGFYDALYLNNKMILSGVNSTDNEMRILEFHNDYVVLLQNK